MPEPTEYRVSAQAVGLLSKLLEQPGNMPQMQRDWLALWMHQNLRPVQDDPPDEGGDKTDGDQPAS
jgi:hypothetical protein